MEACYVPAAVPRNKGMGMYLCSPSLQRPKTEQSVKSCVEGGNVGEGQQPGPGYDLNSVELVGQKMFWDATPVHLEAEWDLCPLGSEGIRRSVVRAEKEQLWGSRGWRGQGVWEVGPRRRTR